MLRVVQKGFEPVAQEVQLYGSRQIELSLEIEKPEIKIAVMGKGAAFANTDPVYRQLRDLGLGETYRVDKFTLNEDIGTFELTSGTLTYFSPVNGIVTGAIFVGEGHFHLKPVLSLDVRELKRRTGSEEVDEDFGTVIFRFGADGQAKFAGGLGERAEVPGEAAAFIAKWRERMRQRREIPISFSQAMLQDENMDNIDADVLAAVYNPKHPPFFNAYIHGKKHHDLRFFVRARVGAMPQLESPEEVALLDFNPDGFDQRDGIWYLGHLKSEYDAHTASSREERRVFATHGYNIETVIAKNHHLFSLATIRFESLVPGERVMKFALLPNLRVARATDESGQDLYFIQEGRTHDATLYVILPQAPPMGLEQKIHLEYAGDKVVMDAGGGSFYVRARSSWYPNLNGFGEKATYDLTFKVPRKYKLVSVGHLASESVDHELAISHWVTPQPVAVAGFNYGEYQKLELNDLSTGTQISGYYLTELPNYLVGASMLQSLAPRAMTQDALNQTRAQLQLCAMYFGKSPYDTIAITEQPNFAFGQSWPNLVYLPISAYMDSTQRWMLFGRINDNFTGFVQEVTPHEVAHQWWGHAVGWASYHDAWLSEGFAEFSAGLFLQEAVGGNWRKDYIEFWERQRRAILERRRYELAPNDVGPLWMGIRLYSERSRDAYRDVVYPKGAYVLEMLRSMMFSTHDGDKAFIEMMHDFVNAHRDRPATTESFKAIAEKHMTQAMNLTGDGRLDWFFNEWVYGTQVPRYRFEYQTTQAEGGKVKLHMTLTESDVDESFAMLVPVFADFGHGMVRLGQFGINGNTTKSVDVIVASQPKKVELNAFKEVLAR